MCLWIWVGSGCSALKLRVKHFKEKKKKSIAVTPVCSRVSKNSKNTALPWHSSAFILLS